MIYMSVERLAAFCAVIIVCYLIHIRHRQVPIPKSQRSLKLYRKIFSLL